MISAPGIQLADVQAVYSGPEGALWRLIMGEQIHIGGLASSMDLATRAEIRAGTDGIDLCCCSGAGMRFLVRYFGVDRMLGVDATQAVIDEGRYLCRKEGFEDRVHFTHADATASGLASGVADFVWGEDAWCYVVDKEKLIAEAVRLVRPGGTIAFTDWVEGATPLAPDEGKRFLSFMKFPSLLTIPGYAQLLRDNGCRVIAADDTGRFAPAIDLYMQMLTQQVTYDALKIIGFDQDLMRAIADEVVFTRRLARDGKLAQGRFIAKKT